MVNCRGVVKYREIDGIFLVRVIFFIIIIYSLYVVNDMVICWLSCISKLVLWCLFEVYNLIMKILKYNWERILNYGFILCYLGFYCGKY